MSPNANATRMGRKGIARWIRKAGIRGAWRCFGIVLTLDLNQRGRPRIRSAANSLPMDRIHFGAADINNLPTSSGFTYLAMEGDLRAVSAA